MIVIPNRTGFNFGEPAHCFDRSDGSASVIDPILSDAQYPPRSLLELSHVVESWRISGEVSAATGGGTYSDSDTYSINQVVSAGQDLTDDDGSKTTTGTAYTSLFDMVSAGADAGSHFNYTFYADDNGSGDPVCTVIVNLNTACRFESSGEWGASLTVTVSIELLPVSPPQPQYITQSTAVAWGTGNDTTSVDLDGLAVEMDLDSDQTVSLTIEPETYFTFE